MLAHIWKILNIEGFMGSHRLDTFGPVIQRLYDQQIRRESVSSDQWSDILSGKCAVSPSPDHAFKVWVEYEIYKLTDSEIKQTALWQSLLRESFLGSLFYTQVFDLPPAINRGTLSRIVGALNTEIRLSRVYLDNPTLSKIAADTFLQLEIQKHFPNLFILLMDHLYKPSSIAILAPIGLAPDINLAPTHLTSNVNNEEKTALLANTFFKRGDTFVCSTIARPSKEGEMMIPLQLRRRENPEVFDEMKNRKPEYIIDNNGTPRLQCKK
jgi:hypothetical protein